MASLVSVRLPKKDVDLKFVRRIEKELKIRLQLVQKFLQKRPNKRPNFNTLRDCARQSSPLLHHSILYILFISAESASFEAKEEAEY